MGFSVQLKRKSLGFTHTIQLPVCWPWMVRGSTAHRRSNGCMGLDSCREAVEGGLVRDAKSQLPEMLLLSLPWALLPTAAQAPTKMSPLAQGNAGLQWVLHNFGIVLPLALHSPAQLWGRAGRDASACDELLFRKAGGSCCHRRQHLYPILCALQTPPSAFYDSVLLLLFSPHFHGCCTTTFPIYLSLDYF